ncbi:hypothetical protein [Aquimarina pacifica]|uniref:hypothetical protein n=1 Tax=Aquimarina pacifica TaxID=1296415 RepID=UPI000471BEC7|nr:hypothetical protein [Aquimarina pacifica]
MITKAQKTVVSKKMNITDRVREEVKSLFDAHPNHDPLYQVYTTLDKNISLKHIATKNEENTAKIDTLRIVEFFNTFYFFESIHDFIRDAYLHNNTLRHGFLTNGVLLRTEKNENKTQVAVGYTIPEFTKLRSERPELYKAILNEIKGELEGFISTDSGEKWYFWPGCEMKIPTNTNIILDTSISKSKFVITQKKENPGTQTTQIVLEEKPYQLEVSLLGDNEIFYTDNGSGNQKLAPGFFSLNKSESDINGTQSRVDFGKFELELHNGEQYEYTLYIPYDSPRSDMKTHLKIYADNEIVEEFIATCT